MADAVGSELPFAAIYTSDRTADEVVVRDETIRLQLSGEAHWTDDKGPPADASLSLHPRDATAARRLRSISSIAAWISGETGLFGPDGGREARCRQR